MERVFFCLFSLRRIIDMTMLDCLENVKILEENTNVHGLKICGWSKKLWETQILNVYLSLGGWCSFFRPQGGSAVLTIYPSYTR